MTRLYEILDKGKAFIENDKSSERLLLSHDIQVCETRVKNLAIVANMDFKLGK